jgi:hypothetical protein
MEEGNYEEAIINIIHLLFGSGIRDDFTCFYKESQRPHWSSPSAG